MRRFSKKRQRQESALRKLEKELDQDPSNHWCWFYPQEPKREYHHIVPKAHNRSLIGERRNLLPVGDTAHEILTRGTTEQRMSLPHWDEYLAKMRELDPMYYQRFIMRFDHTKKENQHHEGEQPDNQHTIQGM